VNVDLDHAALLHQRERLRGHFVAEFARKLLDHFADRDQGHDQRVGAVDRRREQRCSRAVGKVFEPTR